MKIGILSNIASPATDIYRSIHPFRLLGYETAIIDPNNAKWHDLYACDILVASRPNGMQILNVLQEFKRMGEDKKIIVDMDDNLHKLDKSNPACDHFSMRTVQDSVIHCLNIADHIIYSTKSLQDFYEPFHRGFVKSTVIPNAVDFNHTPMREPQPLHTPVRVLWRGSEHHKKDLETIRDFWDWILCEENRTKYEVMFMGLQKHDVHSYFEGALWVGWNPSPFGYWKKLAEVHADVAVFPLERTLFNEGKSNIFALEMLTNGVLPIVPAGFPEFEHPGTIRYSNLTPERFTEFMEDYDRIDIIKAGQQWIRENRDLQKVNEKRREIIENL